VLILLNGPPGSGKSTLAQRYVDDHPLALNLDIDRVRALLGRWPDHAHEAGLAARVLALAMARTHLDAGHDVVIPQYLGRVAFIEQLEQLAAETGVRFHELVLLDSLPNMLRRFAERTKAVRPEHVEADAQLRGGGEPALAEMYDRLIRILDQRPRARIIQSEHGKPHETYRRLLDAIEHP